MSSAPIRPGRSARYLSNLGAEILKVEPLKGESIRGFAYQIDGVGYIFHVHNLNKRGLAIDTMVEDGKAALFDLVRNVDVLIENFAFGRTGDCLTKNCLRLIRAWSTVRFRASATTARTATCVRSIR